MKRHNRENIRLAIIAPFTVAMSPGKMWLTPFISDKRFKFTMTPNLYNENGQRAKTSLSDALGIWKSIKLMYNSEDLDGIIAIFPQRALAASLYQSLYGRNIPIIAWSFNLGELFKGFKKRFVRFCTKKITKFIVHSTGEIKVYSDWLRLPRERFEFLPLQIPSMPTNLQQDDTEPFVLAAGSAKRDYKTFFEAIRILGYRTIVITAKHALSNLKIPNNVKIIHSLSLDQCREMMRKACVNVVPISNLQTASGQVTLVNGMSMGCAIVATRCVGTIDYIEDGVTGLLTKPNSVNDLAKSIDNLWKNRHLRQTIGANAKKFAEEKLSDEVAGKNLERILCTLFYS